MTCRMSEGLSNDEQGGFRYVDQIFTLKQMEEKTQKEKCMVYVGFMDLEKLYGRVNRDVC